MWHYLGKVIMKKADAMFRERMREELGKHPEIKLGLALRGLSGLDWLAWLFGLIGLAWPGWHGLDLPDMAMPVKIPTDVMWLLRNPLTISPHPRNVGLGRGIGQAPNHTVIYRFNRPGEN